MKVHFLGTSCAESTETRDNSCLFLEGGSDGGVLVDCNGSVVPNMKRAGLAFQDIQHIVVTHRHVDHAAGIPSLLEQIWLWHKYKGLPKREVPITFYAEPSALSVIRTLVEAFGLHDKPEHMPQIYYVDFTKEKRPLSIGGFQFSFMQVNHGSVPCYGFRVTEDNAASGLVYSSDTEPVDVIFDACTNDDVLIHECTSFDQMEPPIHTGLPAIEERMESRIKAAQVWLTHLPEGDTEAIQARLDEKYGQRLRLANDLDVIEI